MKIENKATAYSNKATAVRGAERANAALAKAGTFTMSAETEERNGVWHVVVYETREEIVPGFSVCPHCGVCLTNGVGHHNQEVNGKRVKHTAFEYECLGCGEEFGPAISTKAAKTTGTRAPVVNKSSCESPVKTVWRIADEMLKANPAAKRKDIIAACEAAGVAYYTARTQYQHYHNAVKASAK